MAAVLVRVVQALRLRAVVAVVERGGRRRLQLVGQVSRGARVAGVELLVPEPKVGRHIGARAR